MSDLLANVGPVTSLVNNIGKTSAFTFTVPPGFYIAQIFITNNTANAVTGGLKFGTTLGGADIVIGNPVAASAVAHVADVAFLKRRWGKTQTATIYVDAVTSWNSANVDIDALLVRYS